MSAAVDISPAAFPNVAVKFDAIGMPSTKGSARGFVVAGKGGRGPRAIITNDAGPKAKAWAAIVSDAATTAMGSGTPLTGPLDVTVTFWLPRPKSHSTAKGLRADAPKWVAKRPDADKLARCFLDALTGIVFGDDAQIARLLVEKKYTAHRVGASCTVLMYGE